MCGICGCTEGGKASHTHAERIQVEENLLAQNHKIADANRTFFSKQHQVVINLMSSPGSGKTMLLTKTIADLNPQLEMAVVVGDQQTDRDAKRLKSSGALAVQVNTGKVCHLDAHMVGHAVEHLEFKGPGLLFIENIGNLVCPALFDLGETYRVVILSVTEGDDKPLKYPEMFHIADLILLTKIDLLPYVDFDVNKCTKYAKQINPKVKILSLSARAGTGLEAWYDWLRGKQEG